MDKGKITNVEVKDVRRCLHEKVRILKPGEEAEHMQPPYYCQAKTESVFGCRNRPCFICKCGALVCEFHAGKPCGSVLKDGRRCYIRCGLRQGLHVHAYREKEWGE